MLEIYDAETEQSIQLKQATAAEFQKGLELYFESISMKAAKPKIGVRSQESGARRKESEGRRKTEGARRSVFTNMRCSLYFEQNFTEVQKLFSKICARNPQDKLAAIYSQRSLKNRMYGVPQGWSGIEALDEK